MVFKEVNFDLWPILIQVHRLPFRYMNQANAIKLGSLVGKDVLVEDPCQNEKLVRNFLRARVLINLKSP